ncbi:hypothetical protein BpHYR1_038205, partial [Brachionus plicatilis]
NKTNKTFECDDNENEEAE